ncbi:hypothetical protein ACHAWC_008729 [Mediolabrus comicus]
MAHFARLPCIISLRRATQLPLRTIVTSSIAPSLDAAMERPESIVLTESSLYHYSNSHHKNKWTEAFQSFYPSQGLHFSSIDLFRTKHIISSSYESSAPIASLKSLEHSLAADLLHLASTIGIGAAHTVLVARGPIQSLVAQYFLESRPFAGLVLVDPLLLPNDGRVMNDTSQSSTTSAEVENRWNSSLQDLISLLDGTTPNMYKHHSDDKTFADKKNHAHPLLLDDKWRRMHSNTESKVTTSFGEELYLLDSLTQSNNNSRPLLLERGTIPMLICYSGSSENEYEDYYRICAERTAAFHTCGGSGDYFDQVSVLRIPTEDSGGDDLDVLMEQIYEWYDVAVA